MSIFKFGKDYFRSLIVIKNFFFISLLYLLTFLWYSLNNANMLVIDGIKNSILDLLCQQTGFYGVFNKYMLINAIIPVFTFTILELNNKNKLSFLIIRNDSRNSLWNRTVINGIVTALIYSLALLIIGYILGGLICGGFENNWISKDGLMYQRLTRLKINNIQLDNFKTYKVLILIFLNGFLGLITLSLIINILDLVLNNRIIVFLIIVVAAYIEAFINRPIIISHISLGLMDWVNIKSIIFKQIFFIILSFIMYLFGKYLCNEKDYL